MKSKNLQMNRALRSVLFVLLLSVVGIGKMDAQEFTVGTLRYSINDDGTSVTVRGLAQGVSASGSLMIPGMVSHEGTEYSVTTIGDRAFYGCRGFSGGLLIPASVTTIGYEAFMHCEGFTGDLIIPNSVTTIGGSAFSYCWSFNGSLIIGNSVTTIEGEAFFWCEKLTSVSLPNSLSSIGYRAFNSCTKITSFTIGESVTHIGMNAFQGTGWYNTQPSGLLFKDGWCLGYKGDEPTGALVLPMGTKGVTGFTMCTGLTSVSFPSSLLYICNQAFDRCSNLTGDLIIPNSVTTIGYDAFNECNFNSVQYNGDVAQWCGISFSGWVLNCNDLYIGGELVNQLVIPEMVTSIGQYAFGGCGSLTSVTIPNSVTMIGNGAFEACNEISVYYEGDIAQWCGISFGEWPFLANYNLYMENELVTQLEIPETVTSIGQYAFCGCGSLNSVTIPNSVVSIGYGAFCDCINLATVSMLATTPPVLGGWNIFPSSNPNFTIYVPYGSLNTYKTADFWNDYEPYIKPMLAPSIIGYASSTSNDKWNLIAVPLAEDTDPAAVLKMLSEDNDYDLYRYDQSVEGEEWRNYKVDSFNFVNGRGYLYATAVDLNLIIGGEFNEDETKVVNLDYDAGKTNAGWNLVGNPFPCDAYINRSYYMMNENGTGINPVAVSASTPIPPCMGVFVKAEGEGETVVFTRAVP